MLCYPHRIIQRIENPVRIRDGTAAVCVEALHVTKVSHWEFPEKAVRTAYDTQVRRTA